TDADVHFKEGVLKKAIAVAMHDKLDHFALLPEIEATGFWQEMFVATFAFTLLFAARLDKVENPKSKAFAGIGAFNLVRREAFERTEGFPWLRMEIADDFGVGLLLKRHGGRMKLALANEEMSIRWYESLREMVRGLEKNTFSVIGRFSYLRGIAFLVGWSALLLGPWIGLFYPITSVRIVAVVAFFVTFSVLAIMAKLLSRRMLPILMVPVVGQWIGQFSLLRSMYHCWQRGGVTWRGTTYPIEELRKNQRVKI
ncbi:MAG: glycosyltransferase, partial [Pseudomonadota bacterium]